MKLLYLVPRQVYETKMSRVRFDQVLAIDRQLPVKMFGPGWDGWDDRLSPAQNIDAVRMNGDRPAVVLSYMVGNLIGCSIPTMTSYNEAFDVGKVTQDIVSNGYRGVVFHHENDLPRYPWLQADGIVAAHVPHCAEEDVFCDWKQGKDIDVLVAGNLNDYYYPHRVRLMNLAWRVLRKRGYKVVVLRHPGYTLPPREGTFVREDFARLLNRSRLVVTCAMRYHYALAKYSEIAMCRSVALADTPDERGEFFRETTLVAQPHELDSVILDRVEDALDSEGKLKQLADRAYELTRAGYTMNHYAERFIKVMREVAALGPR